MLSYIGFRFLRMVSVVFAVTLLSFLLLNLLPGSPVNAILGVGAGDAQARALLTAQLGLGHPVFERYFIWLGNALHGNLGQSYVLQESVGSAILQALPVTLMLMIMAEIISLGVAIPLALYCSLRPDGLVDKLVNRVNLGLLAMPAFALGPLLIFVFAVKLKVFQAGGYTTWFDLGGGLTPAVVPTPQSIILPAITLAAGQLAIFQRVLRGDLLTTLKSEFILMARSKGFTRWHILVHHALRPSSFSLMSLVGLSVGSLLAGAVIIENIFGLPGMGKLLVTAIEQRDYITVEGVVVIISTGFVFINFLTDAAYGVLDPRVRRARLIG